MITLIKRLLQQIIDRIDEGNSNLSQDEASNLMTILRDYTRKDDYISKYSAYTYLGISRATFDSMVKDGKLPKGRKVVGFKELMWTKKDLDNHINRR